MAGKRERGRGTCVHLKPEVVQGLGSSKNPGLVVLLAGEPVPYAEGIVCLHRSKKQQVTREERIGNIMRLIFTRVNWWGSGPRWTATYSRPRPTEYLNQHHVSLIKAKLMLKDDQYTTRGGGHYFPCGKCTHCVLQPTVCLR